MSESAINYFMDALAKIMVTQFEISKAQAVSAIQRSAIQTLVLEEPEYVNHVSLYDWAKEVYTEMFC